MKKFFLFFTIIFVTYNSCLFSQNLVEFQNVDQFNGLRYKREALKLEIPILKKEIENLRSSFPNLDTNILINYINQDKGNLNSTLSKLIELRNSNDTAGLRALKQDSIYYSDYVKRDEEELFKARELTKTLIIKENDLNTKEIDFSRIENEISMILIPELARRDFMQNIGYIVSFLILCLIVVFFILVFRDKDVGKRIFSSDSGIQFITLFLIIIAITLFGITGVFEAKELSALLGAVAGYILGKSSNRDFFNQKEDLKKKEEEDLKKKEEEDLKKKEEEDLKKKEEEDLKKKEEEDLKKKEEEDLKKKIEG